MTQPVNAPLSAQVILRSASGRAPGAAAQVTAATLSAYLPSPEAVATVTRAFRDLGFAVGPALGNNLSITADRETFERVFGETLTYSREHGARVTKAQGEGGYELNVERLPSPVAALVAAVTFTPPPAFGPSGSGP